MSIELPETGIRVDNSRTSFRSGGGHLEIYGGMVAKFGDVEVIITPDAFDNSVGFINSIRGKDIASVLEDIAGAIKRAGFKSIQYRVDNEDGRGLARKRLFESLERKVESI